MAQPTLLQKLRMSEVNLRVMAVWRRCLPPDDPEAAATYFRAAFDLPRSSFRHRAALSFLPTHYPLLDEENAKIPACFEIQKWAVERAEIEPNAYGATIRMLEKTPIAIIFRSILRKADETGATAIRFWFREETAGVDMEYADGWQNGMTATNELEGQLRGFLFRIEKLGYARLRSYMDVGPTELPQDINCYWESDSTFRMDIFPDREAGQ